MVDLKKVLNDRLNDIKNGNLTPEDWEKTRQDLQQLNEDYTEWMNEQIRLVNESAFHKLKQDVIEQKRLIEREQDKLNCMLESCTCEELKPESTYYSGSYLDTDYTEYWDECVVCRKRYNERTKNHGNYG